MIHLRRRPFTYLILTLACAFTALHTGCASGGFKLTRQYARFVNSNHIVIRIILYILTFVVFAVTMLIDLVVLNTIDFWDGKVSAGSYDFEKDGKMFHVRHEHVPGTLLRRSTVEVKSAAGGSLLQTVVLSETPSGEIEVSVDGVVRARVDSVHAVPQLALFDSRGHETEKRALDLDDIRGKSLIQLALRR